MSELALNPRRVFANRSTLASWPGLFAVALLALAATSGCKPSNKSSSSATPSGPPQPVKVQCQNLQNTVQAGRARFEATQDSADFEKDTRQSALLLQELRDDIGKSGATDDGLKKIATDYQAALSLASSDLTGIATAAKASDNKKVDTLSQQFDAHWRTATSVDSKLTAYCLNK